MKPESILGKIIGHRAETAEQCKTGVLARYSYAGRGKSREAEMGWERLVPGSQAPEFRGAGPQSEILKRARTPVYTESE